MGIFTLIFWIVFCGLIWYAVARWAPIPAGFKTLIYVILCVVVLFMCLAAFGIVIGPPPGMGRVR
jgi:hypothetical protein